MKRITLLDGLRGFFLVFMLLNHLTFAGGFLLGWFNYAHLGYVQSAQGFIFISGLMVGLIYMRIFDRQGPGAATSRLGRRALELYGWNLGLILVILGLSRLLNDTWPAWGAWLGYLYEDGTAYAIAASGLLYQPVFMDILPQYTIYLLFSPLVIWLVASGRVWLVATVSLLAWLVVQLGIHLPVVMSAERALWYGDTDLILQAYFNPLAWQIVFMSGVVIGALLARGQFDTERLFSPDHPGPFRIALGVLAFFAIWRIALSHGLIQPMTLERFFFFDRRGEFSLIYLVSFMAAGYALAWLLIAGPRSASQAARWTGDRLHALFSHPLVMLLGRHALPVYVYHVFLVYMLKLVDAWYGPIGDPLSSLLGFAAIASLVLPALLGEWLKARKARPLPMGAPVQ